MKIVLAILMIVLAVPLLADWDSRSEAVHYRNQMRKRARREIREARRQAEHARIEARREVSRAKEEARRELRDALRYH